MALTGITREGNSTVYGAARSLQEQPLAGDALFRVQKCTVSAR